MIDTLVTDVAIQIKERTGERESSSIAATGAAFGGGFLIYMFIFLYGGLVLRGVQEEKQNRIVEIIISSVKPFQLMMGKILGIAMVGLTQFIVWIVLTVLTTAIFGALLQPDAATLEMAHRMAGPGAHAVVPTEAGNYATYQKAIGAIGSLNLPMLLGMFLFYFLGGYLLYSSLFAACAAAVDSQSDMYQLMFPISLPIVLSIALIGAIIESPDSSLAFWLSIIPFTSPVIMMARLPFDVPWWQMLLSMFILVTGFLLTTWLAGKIYRTGILMYGKKITWKELGKWLFYR
jgi:ABC-2 type transport system permease protein